MQRRIFLLASVVGLTIAQDTPCIGDRTTWHSEFHDCADFIGSIAYCYEHGLNEGIVGYEACSECGLCTDPNGSGGGDGSGCFNDTACNFDNEDLNDCVFPAVDQDCNGEIIASPTASPAASDRKSVV